LKSAVIPKTHYDHIRLLKNPFLMVHIELALAVCLSSLERRKVTIPLVLVEPIIERLRRELPDDVAEKGEEKR